MPEGDTVYRVSHLLHDALAGRPLTRCDLRVPALATVDLTGRTVENVTPRGKHILARVEGGLTLHSHLQMDGDWRIQPAGERPRGPGHWIRAVLGNDRQTAVGYRLPVLQLLRTRDEHRIVGHLGPDLLGPDWDPAEAARRLLAAPDRSLGEALLDQRNLAGIGNEYKSELCFLTGNHPLTPVSAAKHLDRLLELARKLLEANKLRPARVTTPVDRRGRRLWVYGREHLPCHRCGTPVRRAEQGAVPGRERVTYWCPACQAA
ncbi:DNA-formamidopyrimidine glycosylase family protein [Streptomyces polyrhachis]|uniref:DNA-(apurinic or apyrimidinic site) lyase n=1 Tax=Streptomyces polyrhachis TaxID=1282885 RepID=A0ABW2GDG5_9ACTN